MSKFTISSTGWVIEHYDYSRQCWDLVTVVPDREAMVTYLNTSRSFLRALGPNDEIKYNCA